MAFHIRVRCCQVADRRRLATPPALQHARIWVFMGEGVSASARAAIVQLRALLLADAAIDIDHARRLVEAAASRLADPASAQELVETFLCLIQTNPADYGNMHDVEDPTGETLALLSAIEAGMNWRRQ